MNLQTLSSEIGMLRSSTNYCEDRIRKMESALEWMEVRMKEYDRLFEAMQSDIILFTDKQTRWQKTNSKKK